MRSILNLLETSLRNGFVLHGSRKPHSVLVPKKARCESGREASNLTAVYADRAGATIPCLMAMFSRKDPRKGMSSRYSNYGTGTLVVVGENVTFNPGFVHVLPRDTFEEFDDEFVSFVPVEAVHIVTVTPTILWPLLLRGNLDLRIDIPAPW